jgi:hypothetical protein
MVKELKPIRQNGVWKFEKLREKTTVFGIAVRESVEK